MSNLRINIALRFGSYCKASVVFQLESVDWNVVGVVTL
jgi:hypothetical protein